MKVAEGRNTSQSARRTLSILDYLSTHAGSQGLSLAELAHGMTMNKSTLLRLLATLQDFDLVEKDQKDETYRLGLKTLQLAEACLSSMYLRKIVSPFLIEAMEATRETAHLVVYDSGDVVYIDKIDSPNMIRVVSSVGMHMPAHSTAVGKALLAYLPPSAFEEVLAKGLHSRTSNTLTDAQALQHELAKIRSQGYAFDDEENEPEVRCIAAPLFDYSSHSVAAISISGPTSRITPERVEHLGILVKEIAERVSERLGFRGTNTNKILTTSL